MRITQIAARALATVSGLLIFAYTATFVTAHGMGYEFRVFAGPLQFTTISGKRYSLFDDGYLRAHGAGWTVYEAVGRTSFFWQPVPNIEIGYSHNNLHFGTDLVVSPDGLLLFVRRNTKAASPDAPIWTDILDLTSDPPQVVVRGPDCCMSPKEGDLTTTDREGLRVHGQSVLAKARVAGAIDQP